MPGPDRVAVALTVNLPRTVYRLALTTSGARFEIPAALAGRECLCTMIGGYGQILAGNSSVSVTLDATNTVTSEAIAANTAVGAHLADGVPQQYRFPRADRATHFYVDASASCVINIVLCG
jgi:hypothetical protein